MKRLLSKNFAAMVIALFSMLALFAMPQHAKAENTITIDGVTKKIYKVSVYNKSSDPNAFLVCFYLSADKKEYLLVYGNYDLHATYREFPLTRYEEEHNGQLYWGVHYTKNGEGKELFNAWGHPKGGHTLFSSGSMTIFGDPRPSREVFGLHIMGTITDSKHGDGKKHTIYVYYQSENKKPTTGKLTVGEVTDRSIALSWTHGSDNVTPSNKLFYTVTYNNVNELKKHTIYAGRKLSTTIKDLEGNTKYNVKVTVWDESGNAANYTTQQITTKPIDHYHIKVAGVYVNPSNAANLSVIPGVSGTVSYDHSKRTLTLDNATINVTKDEENCIYSEIEGLKIVVKGNCNLTSKEETIECHQASLTITGSGTLNVDSKEKAAIYAYQCPFTIKDCTVNAKGGITSFGWGHEKEQLTIDNATVTAESSGRGSICGFSKFTLLNGCTIVAPVGAVWNAEEKAVYDVYGHRVHTPVVIKPLKTYDLEVAGVQVTNINNADLSVINGVSGKVNYNHSTKTLTLDNATITTENICIHSKIDGLKIWVKGNCTVTTSIDKIAIFSEQASLTITGSGTLNVKESKVGIYGRQCALTIKDCTVNTKGQYGISGHNGSASDQLTIDNATVTAEGSNYGSICRFSKFILKGCAITAPAGAVWNAGEKAVCYANGGVIHKPVTITPVKTYALKVAGVQVTSANAADLSVISGVSGTVNYDHSTKTLTLEDATIKAIKEKGDTCIYSKMAGLKIMVKGNCTLTSTSATILSEGVAFSIEGSGKLNAESKSNTAIYARNCALIIKGCTVNAHGRWGIAGQNGSASDQLTIDNATVTATGKNGSLLDFSKLTLNGCAITAPAGAVWNAAKKAVCDAAGNKTTAPVKIEPIKQYELKVAGVQVTNANAHDLSVISGVSGTVSYDHNTKTLTLDGATINSTAEFGIYSKIDGLKIWVKDNCTVTVANSNETAIYSGEAAFTIAGSGTLNVESKDYTAIYAYQCALTIKDCTVNAKGGKYGITGWYAKENEQLTIDNATVTAEGNTCSIGDFSKFTLLNRCAIIAPAGAVWNAEQKAVCDAAGNKITAKVKIAPPSVEQYEIQVAGVYVTSANAADLSVLPNVAGTVSYDHSTKTLTLEDAIIDATGESENGIYSNIDGLIIEVKGDCVIRSNEKEAIHNTKAFTIAGSGTLNAESSGTVSIFADHCALTIKDCTVNAKGKWGISGRNGAASEQLTIDNAAVTAEGSDGSICDLASFTLNRCAITAPVGAVWNAEKQAVCDADGNVITAKVTIAPVPEGIDGINAETARSRGIYNLHGVKLDTDFDQLPSGVYIVDGQKVMK